MTQGSSQTGTSTPTARRRSPSTMSKPVVPSAVPRRPGKATSLWQSLRGTPLARRSRSKLLDETFTANCLLEQCKEAEPVMWTRTTVSQQHAAVSPCDLGAERTSIVYHYSLCYVSSREG